MRTIERAGQIVVPGLVGEVLVLAPLLDQVGGELGSAFDGAALVVDQRPRLVEHDEHPAERAAGSRAGRRFEHDHTGHIRR